MEQFWVFKYLIKRLLSSQSEGEYKLFVKIYFYYVIMIIISQHTLNNHQNIYNTN